MLRMAKWMPSFYVKLLGVSSALTSLWFFVGLLSCFGQILTGAVLKEQKILNTSHRKLKVHRARLMREGKKWDCACDSHQDWTGLGLKSPMHPPHPPPLSS